MLMQEAAGGPEASLLSVRFMPPSSMSSPLVLKSQTQSHSKRSGIAYSDMVFFDNERCEWAMRRWLVASEGCPPPPPPGSPVQGLGASPKP
jgi:hypothetical protein